MQASAWLGTVWTMLALVGTVWLLFLTIRNLYRDKLERENIAASLGPAYFLLMFFRFRLFTAALSSGIGFPV